MTKALDEEFEYVLITSVRREQGGDYILTREDGFSLSVNAETGIVPRAGQIARFYGKGIGFPVRGLEIDEGVVFYRSPDDEQHRQMVEQAKRRRQKQQAEEKSLAEFEERKRTDPLAFDWEREGPSPEAAAALDRVTALHEGRSTDPESEFPLTYSGQSWRYASRLWAATALDPDLLDGLDAFDDVPGVQCGDLDLTGFMESWARNAVRQMRGKMPKASSALVTLGEVEQPPHPSRGSAQQDLEKVLG